MSKEQVWFRDGHPGSDGVPLVTAARLQTQAFRLHIFYFSPCYPLVKKGRTTKTLSGKACSIACFDKISIDNLKKCET